MGEERVVLCRFHERLGKDLLAVLGCGEPAGERKRRVRRPRKRAVGLALPDGLLRRVRPAAVGVEEDPHARAQGPDRVERDSRALFGAQIPHARAVGIAHRAVGAERPAQEHARVLRRRESRRRQRHDGVVLRLDGRHVSRAAFAVKDDGVAVGRVAEGRVIADVLRDARELGDVGPLGAAGQVRPAGKGAVIAGNAARRRISVIGRGGVQDLGLGEQDLAAFIVHPCDRVIVGGKAAEGREIDGVLRHRGQRLLRRAAGLARVGRPAGEGPADEQHPRVGAAVSGTAPVRYVLLLPEDLLVEAPGHGVAAEFPDGVEVHDGAGFRAQVFDRLAVGVLHRAVFGQRPAEEVVAGVRESVLCQGLRRVIDEGLIRHRPLAAPGVEADGVGVRGLGEGRVIGRVRRHAREVDAGGLVRRGGPALKGALVALPRPGRRRTGVDGLGVLRVGFDREDVSAVKAAPGHGVILRRKATEGGVVNDVLCHGLQLADSLAAALARRRRPACKGAAGGEGLRAGVDRLGAVLCGISLEHLIAAAPGHRVAVDLPDGVEVHDGVRFRAQVLHGLAVGVLHCAV